MAFFQRAYNTRQYESACIGDSTKRLEAGCAVVLKKLAFGIAAPDFYHQVAVCDGKEAPFGVVSASPGTAISSASPGQVVLMNSGLIPVLLNAASVKGDLVRPKTMDGKWEKIAAGETGYARLLEDGAGGDLAWAIPVNR